MEPESEAQTRGELSPRVCALIVHYRDPRSLAACLDSLARTAGAAPAVVVDNDSGEPHASEARRIVGAHAGAHFIAAERNGGFGAGCNRGFDFALERFPALEHVLLLNPDAELEAGCLAALLTEARTHPEAGAIGGRVLDGDGARVLFENGRLRPYTLSRLHVAAPRGALSFETEFITGALMLVSAALLRAGLRFDERYFLYVEDLDLGCEIRARGCSLRITLEARARHRSGGSHVESAPVLGDLRERQLYEMTRSKVLFARKRLPWFQRWIFYGVAVALKPFVGLVLERRTGFLKSYVRGLIAGMRLRLDSHERGADADS